MKMVKRHLRKYRKGNKDIKCSRCIVSNCSDTHTHTHTHTYDTEASKYVSMQFLILIFISHITWP